MFPFPGAGGASLPFPGAPQGLLGLLHGGAAEPLPTGLVQQQEMWPELLPPSQGKGGAWGSTVESAKRMKVDDDESAEMCKFFANGFCGFGDQCHARHVAAPAKQKDMCEFFMKGFCGFGDKCYKSHDIPRPDELCPFFQNGYCGFGDNCMKAHVLEVKKELCPFFAKGFCGFGDKCFKAHTGGPPKKAEAWEKYADSSLGKRGNNDVSQIVQIPAKRVKDLMGLQGGNIRKIQQISGCYTIKVVDEEDSKMKPPEELVAVEVRGGGPAVEIACKMVLQVAEGDQSCIGHIEISMEIEPRLVSKIIGTKGEVIQQMQKQSGVRLAVRGGERGTNQLPKLMMTGPPENVMLAKSMVEEYIKANADRPSQGFLGPGEEENSFSMFGMAPSFLTAGSAAGDIGADDLAAAQAATMASWGPSSAAAGAMPGMGGALPDFDTFSNQAMAAAQEMAMQNMQQMMMAQMMAAQAAAPEPQAAAPAKEKEDTRYKEGANKLASSLMDKLKANRKRQAEGSV